MFGYIYVIIKVKRLSEDLYTRVQKRLSKVILTDSFWQAFTNAPYFIHPNHAYNSYLSAWIQ